MTYVTFSKNGLFLSFGKYYSNREYFSIGLWSNTSWTLGLFIPLFQPTKPSQQSDFVGFALDFLSRNTAELNYCREMKNLGVLF